MFDAGVLETMRGQTHETLHDDVRRCTIDRTVYYGQQEGSKEKIREKKTIFG